MSPESTVKNATAEIQPSQNEIFPADTKNNTAEPITDHDNSEKNSNGIIMDDARSSAENNEADTHTDLEPHESEAEKSVETQDLDEILAEMEKISGRVDGGADYKKFGKLREIAVAKITEETSLKKAEFQISEPEAQDFTWNHPLQEKLNILTAGFKEKQDQFLKNQDEEQSKALAQRQAIIDKLKNLYSNTEPGTNLFRAIREIKDEWSKAGQIAKADFKLLNNNYFHHLNQFYAMLDLNKEYLEQEYSHNLEKRRHIISRAKELLGEPVVQKALNELQFLHKLWREEAEPVAPEFRDATWDEFKEISSRIHDRKAELETQLEAEQLANLEKKNGIIEQIKTLSAPAETGTHNHWQNAIRVVEQLREDFLKTGPVPRKLSNQNWTDFKLVLREFNTKKNDYYKNLKGSQSYNLARKQALIQSAKDNMNSEDWETAVPLFKKLQDEWKTIGHVPRAQANKIWDEFRTACNTFFDNYRIKNNAQNDNWKENYISKKEILDQLKEISDAEGSAEKIDQLKAQWNAIGKVPKDKLSINTEFNKVLREKLRLNKMSEFDLKDENLSENQITDKARKMKNQIADLEAEIAVLENNLGFFSNPSRENILLKDTYTKLDAKKEQLEQLRKNLRTVISGE